MTSRILATGHGAAGAIAYATHDAPTKDTPRPKTQERVAGMAFYGMPDDPMLHANPQIGARIIQNTISDAPLLKRRATGKNGGRKLKTPIVHIGLSWKRGERPTREEMFAAGRSWLRANGFKNHQAVLVAHVEEDGCHHLHLITNRVNPVTGIALERNLALGGSRWAERFERKRGDIQIPLRVEANARRADLRALKRQQAEHLEKNPDDRDRALDRRIDQVKRALAEIRSRREPPLGRRWLQGAALTAGQRREWHKTLLRQEAAWVAAAVKGRLEDTDPALLAAQLTERRELHQRHEHEHEQAEAWRKRQDWIRAAAAGLGTGFRAAASWLFRGDQAPAEEPISHQLEAAIGLETPPPPRQPEPATTQAPLLPEDQANRPAPEPQEEPAVSGGPQQEPAEASAEGEARARAEETLGTIQTRIAKHKDGTGKPFELDLDTLTHLSAESLRGELGQREWGPPDSTERRKVMAQELGALCDKGDARRDDVQEFCRWVERHRAERETEKRRQSRGASPEETLGSIQTRIAKHKDWMGKPFELDLDTLTHLSAESLRGQLGQREWGSPGSTERRKVMAQELGALCDEGDARRDDVQEFCRWVERHRAERETEKRRQSRGATPEETLGTIQTRIAKHKDSVGGSSATVPSARPKSGARAAAPRRRRPSARSRRGSRSTRTGRGSPSSWTSTP